MHDRSKRARAVGTALISRAEVAAALTNAVRVHALTREEALACLQVFREEWPDLVRVQVSDMVIARADSFAWELGLRDYDAIHLAAASLWQDAMGDQVLLPTFHPRLWAAAERVGLARHPADLPALLDRWKATR